MSNTTTKHNIVMFRLKPPQLKTLTEILKREPIIGVSSNNQFARKIVKDFLEGRLAYTNPDPKYRLMDTELAESE